MKRKQRNIVKDRPSSLNRATVFFTLAQGEMHQCLTDRRMDQSHRCNKILRGSLAVTFQSALLKDKATDKAFRTNPPLQKKYTIT